MARTLKLRKIEETSWLAQEFADQAYVESERMEIFYPTARYFNMHMLKIIVNLADDPDNPNVYRENRDGKLWIIICDIPDLSVEEGSGYSRYGIRCKLSGIAESYKDQDGGYTVHVLQTHDLNSCTINVSDLMDSIRLGF